MLNIRPGIAFLAVSIAITIVTTLLYVILGAILAGAGLSGKEDVALVGVVTLVISIGTIFVVADYLWKPLCGWATRA